MTSAFKVFLMLVLLLQGTMASAMPKATLSAMATVEAEQAMPCHDMADMGEVKKSCCDDAGQACHAICAALALPMARYVAPMPSLSVVVLSTPQSGVLAAHRAALLRPPIPLSA